MTLALRGSIFLWALVSVISCMVPSAQAAQLTVVRDLISTSQKSVSADHTINFTATHAIPAGGRIVITPVSGAFTIPADMGIDDVDFAVATTSDYLDRIVASSSSLSADGVSIVPGTAGSFTIILNDSAGISAGERIEFRIGTVAVYDEQGNASITNPSTTGSYRIHIATADASGVAIDSADAMIAIIEQVGISVRPINLEPVITNALPSGIIPAGTRSVELSFNTDQFSTCRYSTTASTSYALMTQSFNQRNSKSFTVVVSGFQDDTTYSYYVRCETIQHTANSEDYVISFSLAPTPETNLSLDEGVSNGSGGGSGGTGQYSNGVRSLYASSIALVGFTIPGSTVSILLDGKQKLTARAKDDGSFRSDITGLDRGTHTLTAYTTDSRGRASASFTSTLTLDSNTTNIISDAVIPPTIAIARDSIAVGDDVELSGEGAPGTVEIMVSKQSDGSRPRESKLYVASTSAASLTSRTGAWSYTIRGSDMPKGAYFIKARTIRSGDVDSVYGKSVALGVGQEAPANVGNRSDINKDGKVNLIDFSIMLVSWGKSDPDADINEDDTVNLADFSILLFNWTG